MTCTHCGATMYTCKGYLTQMSPDGTLPLIYACRPSCNGFPRAQGVLILPDPPARSSWRDRQTDPPPPPPEDATDATGILVIIDADMLCRPCGFPMVLYWWRQHDAWLDIVGSIREWTQWQPIDLPPLTAQEAAP